jgi:hypothetical protein
VKGESGKDGDGGGEGETVCDGGATVVESLPSEAEAGLMKGRVYWRIPELTRQGIFCAKVKTALAAHPEAKSHGTNKVKRKGATDMMVAPHFLTIPSKNKSQTR